MAPPNQSSSEPAIPEDYRDRYERLTGRSLRECPICHRGPHDHGYDSGPSSFFPAIHDHFMIDPVRLQLALSKNSSRRVQGVVLSYRHSKPHAVGRAPRILPYAASEDPQSQHTKRVLCHYLRLVLSMAPPTHQSKPIAHAPCSGSVQYIFSSPAWLRSRFLSVYAYCRHGRRAKMLCISSSGFCLIPHDDKTCQLNRSMQHHLL